MDRFTINTHHAYLNNDIVLKYNGTINVSDIVTGKDYRFADELSLRLSAGKHVFVSGDQEETVFIEDAIKLGGSSIKKAFVFDENPWIFLLTKDRMYVQNRETGEERVEFNFSPEEILYETKGIRETRYFVFKTKGDYSIYDAKKGEVLFRYSNHIFCCNHVVIYKKDDGNVSVFDFLIKKEIVCFSGQYSLFANNFYFVKDDNRLYRMNLYSQNIIVIEETGYIGSHYLLYNNYLLKCVSEGYKQYEYQLFGLGNGEKYVINQTKLKLPYMISNWMGVENVFFNSLLDKFDDFYKEHYPLLKQYSIKRWFINRFVFDEMTSYYKRKEKMMLLRGRLIIDNDPWTPFKNAMSFSFELEGELNNELDFNNAVFVQQSDSEADGEVKNDGCKIIDLNEGENIISQSDKGKLFVTKEDNNIYLRNLSDNSRVQIFEALYDSSNYSNAFFTSDSKVAVFNRLNKQLDIFGFEDLDKTSFEVDGSTVSRNCGVNGYNFELDMNSFDGRLPVWRDPITLERIEPRDILKYSFVSPDGKWEADNNFKVVYYDRLLDKEITFDEYCEIRKKYDFTYSDDENEKKKKIEERKSLMQRYGIDKLSYHILENCKGYESDAEKIMIQKNVSNTMEYYLNDKEQFTSLFIDSNGFVIYRDKGVGPSINHKILIGRSVWFLNYVAFSYDSRFLAFGAKMKEDDFRHALEGVFVLYDLENNKEIIRSDKDDDLYAVWMAMFSKKGDVAYYDSRANAYLSTAESNYEERKIAEGKSLLCFSPSGNYIALSDQNYIDYTHHPDGLWGHQPSGNIFIHKVSDFEKCVEQYNDFGDGIEGVASRAGCVASAAFSQDEKRLLAVGTDGVVVVRNLHNT